MACAKAPMDRTVNRTANTYSPIARGLDTTRGQFIGYIDSVTIYDRALSQPEMTDHANGLW